MRVNPEHVPRGHAVLRCETCTNDIGFFRPDELKVPMTGHMFKSLDPKHGFPPPFPVEPERPNDELAKWEYAMCPYCGRRPFLTRDHVMTPHGLYKVGDPSIPRRETMEEVISRRNQEAINREWTQEEEKGKTLEEKHQEVINELFESDPETHGDPHPSQPGPASGNDAVRQERPAFICPGCGAEFRHQSSLSRHKQKCKKFKKGGRR